MDANNSKQIENIAKFSDDTLIYHLQQNLVHLLQQEDYHDVTLEADGRQFKANKLVLAASSPYFK